MISAVLKTFLILVGFLIAGIPTWIFLLIKNSLNPTGFWQNLVAYGLGAYFLWGVQLVLAILFLGYVGLVLESNFGPRKTYRPSNW